MDHTAMEPRRPILRFQRFELDVGAFALRRDGRPVRIERQPMELLVRLVERRGQLVSRSEIAELLWAKDVFVDVETGVNTAIRKVRQALRDSADAPMFIETVQGKGYRFIAPVEVLDTPADASRAAAMSASSAPAGTAVGPPPTWASAPRRRVIVVALGLLAAAVLGGAAYWRSRVAETQSGPVRLAVLPFENLTGSAEHEYLADGIAEEATGSLGRIDPDHLTVLARGSVLGYRGSTKSPAEIGRELGVQYVVEGSLRAEPPRLRISCRLVRTNDQAQVWSASYDREPGSFLGLQQEISTAIAEQVRLRLTPARAAALSRRGTDRPEAYDFYLRGRYYFSQLSPPTVAQAIELYTRAAEIDPGYALAWAGLADAYSSRAINSDYPPLEVRHRAAEAAERAVRADATLSEAHAARAYVRYFLDWNWPEAETSFRHALDLDRGNARAERILGQMLSQRGLHAEGLAALARARASDPLNPMSHALSAQVAFQAREFDAAAAHARQAVVIDPEFWIGHMQLGQALERLGRRDEALDSLTTATRLSRGNSKPLSLRGYTLAVLGRTSEAREVLRTFETLAGERYVPPYAMALVHAGLGNRDETFAHLDRAVAHHDVHLVFLPVDAKWDPLRNDPRFATVLARCDFARTNARAESDPAR